MRERENQNLVVLQSEMFKNRKERKKKEKKSISLLLNKSSAQTNSHPKQHSCLVLRLKALYFSEGTEKGNLHQ